MKSIYPIALFLLMSSCITACCLSVISFIAYTGEIPIFIAFFSEQISPKNDKDGGKKKIIDQWKHHGESYVVEFIEELSQKDKELTMRKKILDEKQLALEEMIMDIQNLQQKLQEEEKQRRATWEIMTQQNMKIGMRTATLISEVEINVGVEMIMNLNENQASQASYYMDDTPLRALLEAMMKDNDSPKKERAVNILNTLQRLAEPIKLL